MASVPRTTVTEGRPMALSDVAPALGAAQLELQRVAYPGVVDLVTRELVRIMSGRQSHCRICRNLRLRAAIDRGFEESMADQIDDFEHSDLPDRQKAALRLAHCFLTDPRAFDEAAQNDLLEHFGPDEIAELILDLVRFRPGSKLTVAAGTEPETEGLVYW
ncbi:MAG TPA: hypothetical protein VMU76_04305 [Acidimicrobiales bacterium]|nr:hypothetical protein [Acidimicrobiales bacterium]